MQLFLNPKCLKFRKLPYKYFSDETLTVILTQFYLELSNGTKTIECTHITQGIYESDL